MNAAVAGPRLFSPLLYLAGPMRNRPYCNSVAATNATDALRAKGLRIISPWEMDADLGINFTDYPTGTEPLPPGPLFTLPALMERDLQAISISDGVVTLPGWEFSTGASVEVAYARFLSKPVYSTEEFL